MGALQGERLWEIVTTDILDRRLGAEGVVDGVHGFGVEDEKVAELGAMISADYAEPAWRYARGIG